MRLRRIGYKALRVGIAAAVVGVLTGGMSAAAAPPGGNAEPRSTTWPAGPSSRWVTLVTGDRVLVRGTATAGADVLQMARAAGRAAIAFHRYTERGHVYVVPSDAAALVRAGTVDKRLFDLTALVAYDYDDRSRSDLPLIVSYAGDRAAPAARTRASAGSTVQRELSTVDALAVRQDKRRAPAFWASITGVPAGAPKATGLSTGLTHLWLDAKVRPTLDRSVPQIGAPAAWAAGHTGRGATVAVLDTGIDATHPDLAGAVADARDFSESGSTEDKVGHGTHVASIVTGSGAASAGRFAGVAPDTTLLNGKVFDDTGSGFESGIIAGMEWAATEKHAPVINMSLGSRFVSDGTEPMDLAVNQLTEQTGSLFVVAAGNSGPSSPSIGSPGAADAALTVGAVDVNDQLAEFSSRGPRFGDHAIKPDITGPGVDITAARAAGTEIGPLVGDQYQRLSGTSMATPHVAGAAAILAGQHPGWKAGQLKAALMGSAKPAAGQTVFEQGAGRVDVARATTQPVTATPGNLSQGVVRWPHADDNPITSTLTYHNTGTAPVTLDLATDIRDPAGTAAPAGMFRLSTDRLTVPAGGDATATLTTDTTVDGPDGTYSGVLTATGPDVSVRTPTAVEREVESYDVTLTFLDRTGAKTPNYFARFVNLDGTAAFAPYDESGTVVARLPKGSYLLDSDVVEAQVDEETFPATTVIVEPYFTVTGDSAVTFDARAGLRPRTDLDRPEARTYGGVVTFLETTPLGEAGSIWGTPDFEQIFVRPSRTVAPTGRFTFGVQDQKARPDGAGGFAGTPYIYAVEWTQDGRVPVPTRRIRDRDLAAVSTRIADAGALPGRSTTFDRSITVRPPTRFTGLYTPGVQWFTTLRQFASVEDFDIDASQGGQRAFDGGRGQSERWNAAVFGPSFPAIDFWAGRLGDQVLFSLPMYSDSGESHFGFSKEDTFTNRLLRDGQLVTSEPDSEFGSGSGFYNVPAGPATYRFETTGTRSVSTFTTRLSAAWTFRSDTVPGPDRATFPLMAVRFAPDVDDRNRAPAGQFDLPVSVQWQQGTQHGTLTSLTVQASYDDGKTWQQAPVTGSGDHRTVHLRHPHGATFVSLRTTATDSAGNTVEETLIHAYALKK